MSSSSSSFSIGIVGWTGLVGQTLFYQLLTKGVAPSAIACYNSKNLAEIRGVHFGTLYLACMPAAKWWANQNPAADRATLDGVLEALGTVQADRVFLMSTVDVLRSDFGSTEESCEWSEHTYGTHRRLLETWVQTRWPSTSYILRLPALFGRGLKKNALYDLLHGKAVGGLCLESEFQWYNLARLLGDCEFVASIGSRLVHLVSPPLSMRIVVDRWFPGRAEECKGTVAISYTLRTSCGANVDGAYWVSKDCLLVELGAWIAWEQWRIAHKIAVSNIGFTMTADMAASLRHLGVTCLEVAPTRGLDYAEFTPLSMQSVLWGTGISNIFWESTKTLEHLGRLMESAKGKGIRVVVFGCPRQRDLGQGGIEEARDFFRRLGDLAGACGITVCLEPNAEAYGCTWLTTVADTLRFVQDVQHPNIRLSLDSGNYWMQGDITPLLDIGLEWIGHLQISGSWLGTLSESGEKGVAKRMVESLWSRGYQGIVSYEAREPECDKEYLSSRLCREEGIVPSPMKLGKEYLRGAGTFMDCLESAYRTLYS